MEWLVGPSYLFFCWALGLTVLTFFKTPIIYAAPAIGIFIFSIYFSILILLGYSSWSASAFLVTIGLAIWRLPRILSFVGWPTVPALTWVGLATVGTIATAALPPAHDIFWAIYNLTMITPGDAPGALVQAQYLLHPAHLRQGFENFAIFDRPFLGAALSGGVLCSINQCPGATFYAVPREGQIAYTSLWIWLNALSAFGIWRIVHAISPKQSVALTIFISASPFIVFNTIGLWPKLLALYFFVIACELAISRRYLSGTMVAAMSFLWHGSFLWPALSLAGLSGMYVLFIERSMWRAISIGFTALVIPSLWFGFEKIIGGPTPLRDYYLYSVDVTEGLRTSKEQMASAFYGSTDRVRLMILPVANLLRSFLPIDLISVLSQFNPQTKLPELRFPLLWSVLNRPIWFGGLILGCVSLFGLIKAWGTQWKVPAAVLVCVLFPLLPAAALFRRFDILVTVVFTYAVIPAMLGIGAALYNVKRQFFALIAAAVTSEYLLVFALREQNPLYIFIVITGLFSALVCSILNFPREPAGADVDVVTTGYSLNALAIMVLVALPLLPLLSLYALKDGGVSLPWVR